MPNAPLHNPSFYRHFFTTAKVLVCLRGACLDTFAPRFVISSCIFLLTLDPRHNMIQQ